jgi:hypothetical protein
MSSTGGSLNINFDTKVAPAEMASSLNVWIEILDANGNVARRQTARVSAAKNGKMGLRATIKIPANRTKSEQSWQFRVVADSNKTAEMWISLGSVKVAAQRKRR